MSLSKPAALATVLMTVSTDFPAPVETCAPTPTAEAPSAKTVQDAESSVTAMKNRYVKNFFHLHMSATAAANAEAALLKRGFTPLLQHKRNTRL